MTTTLTIRMDDALKADAEDFFDDIGMNLTTAITCFFKKCLATGEIPFTIGAALLVVLLYFLYPILTICVNQEQRTHRSI